MKRLLAAIIIITSLLQSMITSGQINRASNKSSISYKANYQRISSSCSGYNGFEIRGGTLWGWGFNLYGQIGDGTTTYRPNAVQIGTDNKWIIVTTGFTHSLAIKSDGTLWTWGKNDYG